jgi:hypothetical protein
MMASYGGVQRCAYCGSAPCVGEDCPSNDPASHDDDLIDFDDDEREDFGLCDQCGCALRVGESAGLCYLCELDGDAAYEPDPRDYEAEQ